MATRKKNKKIPRKQKANDSALASHLLDAAGYGIFRYLLGEEKILFANQGVVDIMGLRCKPEELTGKCFDDIFALSDKPEIIKKVSTAHGDVVHAEYHIKTLAGEEKWILFDARIKKNPTTRKEIAEAIIRDITYLKLSEHNLTAFNHKLKMLVECSQTIVHATNEQELLEKICEIIIKEGGYRFTWIGLARGNEQKTVEPIVWAGYEKGYLKTIRVSWGINEDGQGPVGTAIRTGKPNINRNILVDPQYGLWREEALRRGYSASVSLPLSLDTHCIGALNIYASQAEAFDPDEVQLLLELASDISYGITTLRARSEKNRTEAALAESEERFRKAFETTGIGMALVALDGRWLKVNRTLCEIVGYTTEELLSMSFQDITHPDDLGTDVSYVQKMLRREILYYHQEKRYLHKQDHIIWVLLSASLVSSSGGEPLYFVFQIQNITDRKKAEEALRDGKRFLSSCFSSIQDGINILDKEMNILRVNPIMETWYAHAMPLVGKKCYQAYHSRSSACTICPSAQTLSSGKAAYEEVPKRGPGGEIVGWLDLYSFPLIDQETGTMKGVIEYVRDITERKRTEEALKESKARFEQIANNAYEWIWEIDRNGLYVYSNPAVERILGYRPEEIVGKKYFYDFFSPKTKEQLTNDAFSAFKRQRPIRNFINPCVTKNGAIVVLEKNGTLILDKQGACCGYRGIDIDVTQRKALEELKDNFINTISHELKTPLSIAKEGVSLVLDRVLGDINEKQERILTIAKNNADRLARIISKLISISLIQSGEMEFKRIRTDIVTIARHILVDYELKAQEKGIKVRLSSEKEKITLYVDERSITHVFHNLLDNAVKFTHVGSIELVIRELPTTVECSVTDTGLGIDAGKIHKLFDKFQQLERSDDAGEKGTGIGLSIARSIIQMHEGNIWVESPVFPDASQEYKGSRFVFSLPKYDAAAIVQKHIDSGIEKATRKNTKMSVLAAVRKHDETIVSEFPREALFVLFKDIEEILKGGLRSDGDVVLEDTGDIIMVLGDCDKENSYILKGRLQKLIDEYLISRNLSEKISMYLGSATYPDDAADEATLLAKAKNIHPEQSSP